MAIGFRLRGAASGTTVKGDNDGDVLVWSESAQAWFPQPGGRETVVNAGTVTGQLATWNEVTEEYDAVDPLVTPGTDAGQVPTWDQVNGVYVPTALPTPPESAIVNAGTVTGQLATWNEVTEEYDAVDPLVTPGTDAGQVPTWDVTAQAYVANQPFAPAPSGTWLQEFCPSGGESSGASPEVLSGWIVTNIAGGTHTIVASAGRELLQCNVAADNDGVVIAQQWGNASGPHGSVAHCIVIVTNTPGLVRYFGWSGSAIGAIPASVFVGVRISESGGALVVEAGSQTTGLTTLVLSGFAQGALAISLRLVSNTQLEVTVTNYTGTTVYVNKQTVTFGLVTPLPIFVMAVSRVGGAATTNALSVLWAKQRLGPNALSALYGQNRGTQEFWTT